MNAFIKKFLVILIVCLFISGIFLSNKLFKMNAGSFILYTFVPMLLGLLFSMSLFEKKAGMLAFATVAIGLFIYLLLIDKNMPQKFYIFSSISAGVGLLFYLFQIKD